MYSCDINYSRSVAITDNIQAARREHVEVPCTIARTMTTRAHRAGDRMLLNEAINSICFLRYTELSDEDTQLRTRPMYRLGQKTEHQTRGHNT